MLCCGGRCWRAVDFEFDQAIVVLSRGRSDAERAADEDAEKVTKEERSVH